jgi:hypothetical protein
MLNILDFRGVTFCCIVSLPCARAPSVSGVDAAKPAPRFYTMSLRRPHPLQRLVRQRRGERPMMLPHLRLENAVQKVPHTHVKGMLSPAKHGQR